MLVLLSLLEYRYFWHVVLCSGRQGASLRNPRCRLARGETARNNAGCGNYIVQAILVRIRDDEALRTAFGPRDLQHRVSHIRNINRLFHNPTPTMLISISYAVFCLKKKTRAERS